MDKLTLLTKHHKDWVKVVNSFGEYFFADDIVQETYLKILRLNHIDKIVTDTINKSMMWLVLRSVYIDHIRAKKNDPHARNREANCSKKIGVVVVIYLQHDFDLLCSAVIIGESRFRGSVCLTF